MPRLPCLLCGCLFLAAAPSLALSQPDAAGKKLHFLGPAPPEELKVLAPLVGQWSSKWEARPSVQDKDGYVATGQATGQWLHNNHFIRLEGTMATSTFRNDYTLLYSYDARKKVYRRWLFSSSGLVTDSEGQWDEAKRTMTWKALHLSPNVTGGITEIVAADRIETTLSLKNADGRVLVDMKVVATRK